MTAAGLMIAWSVTGVAAQEVSVKSGVYTAEQADRGRARYEATCQRCHGADLSGGAGRALTGDVFLRDWTGLTLDGLFERMQSMPPGGAAGLEPDAYVDIISYVLQRNGYPDGSEELSGPRLARVFVEGDEGRDVVPNFALVRVVGCLGGSAADGWTLSTASPEARASEPAASVDAVLEEARATPLGDRAFTLMYVFPSPDALVGHRVETKGLLIRAVAGAADPPVHSLNVTSVQSLSETCP